MKQWNNETIKKYQKKVKINGKTHTIHYMWKKLICLHWKKKLKMYNHECTEEFWDKNLLEKKKNRICFYSISFLFIYLFPFFSLCLLSDRFFLHIFLTFFKNSCSRSKSHCSSHLVPGSFRHKYYRSIWKTKKQWERRNKKK